MEVVQKYMNTFHRNMDQLNTLKPSIEPRASGHIIEQQELVRQLLRKGFAYEINGSVYFDVEKYNRKYKYGKLSGRILEDLMANTRELEGQDEKRNPCLLYTSPASCAVTLEFLMASNNDVFP